MSKRLLVVLCSIAFIYQSCSKDSNLPSTPTPTNASFTLVTSGSNCSVTSVQGTYTINTVLISTNTITVQVNVSSIGKYSVFTPTVNGISFIDSGSFTTTGIQNITLKGSGTPTVAGTSTFDITAGTSCSFNIIVADVPPSGPSDNDHMLFGNPSNAAALTDSFNNYLMRKSYYTVSYSRYRGTPNWVSWHLWSLDLGSTPRQDDFRPDNSLPTGWYQVPSNGYSSSGFDRGHNCPSADRTSSINANSSTFLMTNMIPQAPNNNQQTWANLEDSLRRLVNFGSEVYIIMGTYGVGGSGSNGFATTIDGGHVTVPSNIWKVAVVIPIGNNDTTRVDASTRIISVVVPNINTVNSNWKNYRTSIDAIEASTGYNLLSRLSVSLQSIIEAKIDNL